jgi:hypothetical protein
VEFEYERHGTVCYQAFLNVFTGKVYGEVVPSNGINTFERTLAHCLDQPPYQGLPDWTIMAFFLQELYAAETQPKRRSLQTELSRWYRKKS